MSAEDGISLFFSDQKVKICDKKKKGISWNFTVKKKKGSPGKNSS